MMTRPRSARFVIAVASAALLAASCAEIVEPEGFTLPTSTTVADADSGASSVEAPAVTSTTSPIANDFVPRADEDFVPEVLMTTPDGIFSAGPLGVAVLEGVLADHGATRVVDDLLGGLVAQQAGGLGEIIWLEAPAEEPKVVDDEGGRLLDVGYIDGSPSALVLLEGNRIDQIRLADNVRTPLVELDDDEEILSLSASGGLHAVVLTDERCGELRFYLADGSMVDLNGPAQPECPVPRLPAFGAVALSPDGGAVVYTTIDYREDGLEVSTDLVARDLSTGSVYYARRIGNEGDRITDISFDGDRVVFLRLSADGEAVSLLELARGRTETPVDLSAVGLVGTVSFPRLPLAEG